MAGLVCCICGESYLPHACDHLWVCAGCTPNLQAGMDRTRPEVPYVDEDLATRLLLEQAQEARVTLSPRQVQAMTHIAQVWGRRAAQE